jgi:outer membrane receptor protein involved in Fe transport
MNPKQSHPVGSLLRVRVVGLLAGVVLSAGVCGAFAQQAPAPATPVAEEMDLIQLNALVVTGTARPGATVLKSSISVSTLPADRTAAFAPRSTVEIFRTLPGIRAEATSGEGNANITVRGAPISAGGSRYLQLQEDGLPLLQFGDIAFATSDSFLRADYSVAHIEAIRGGSASTFASNSPGGIINFISKTGQTAGGSVGFTYGLDYDTQRLDFDYGRPVSDTLRFHVGGYFRMGEGPRTAGYDANKGGQLKFNVTKDFKRGSVRVSFKHLDDRTITYLPIPMRVTGTNSNPSYSSIAGFDKKYDTLNTPFLKSALILDGNGNRRVSDLEDGIHAVSTSLGAELQLDLGGGWTLTDKARFARNSGDFISPFPAEVDGAQTIANSIGGAGATLRYANGPRAGQVIANPAALNGNGLLARVHLFNTALNNFDLTANDLRLSKLIELDAAKIDVTAGFYLSRQTVDMDWTWATYLQEVKSEGALINVFNAASQRVTDNGLVAYGVPFWGNLHRSYEVDYDTAAPFAAVTAQFGRLTLDASVRLDQNKASGRYAGNIQRANVDMNQDGVISVPEQSVSAVDNAAAKPVNYDVNFTSYSLGANYGFTQSLAAFGRYSLGASASADRILFGNSVRANGTIVGDQASYNEIKQLEAGLKYQTQKLVPGTLGLFATFFHAETTESNYELTSQRFTERVYGADGVELEAAYALGGFEIRAGGTWTDAQIDKAETATLVGKTPRRQAEFTYQLSPSYTWKKLSVGTSVIGTTKAYAQDDNRLVFPAYAYVNAFVAYTLRPGLTLSINANNLFNEFGLSEAEEGSIPSNGIVRARGITGRTVSTTLRYSF